ncbi:dol-P-Glc:Glc(2)Man(9)GlcNAc(2)-PP-Dol alpha-1,2-glucosyltransferase [Talpa occidentalis]|uniref:dol-P-Glc:Glc(2)Man(9)GlcNAc(2)-PP-Dol alpha-1,2-glucosyltransferase n=1 Tax=Talpa occidentalis TaxID=50954 RepID=UPI0018907AA0|nr:dol-P-Glc:Glc(2)Man(9)GlcNAc(2)-PP-Dol alpha-1,2-glucosyltransferase [Talpa occidentalis]
MAARAAPLEGCYLSAALSGAFLVSCLLFAAVGRALREPYMDETFHVPQAQRFCEGRFSPAQWDPMITTLPGLYLLSAAVLRPAGWVLGWPARVACSAWTLRLVNLLLGAGNLYLLHLLLREVQPGRKAASAARRVLSALTLAASPPLFLVTFLYYTEPGAVFFALAAHLMGLRGRHGAAALLGLCAVLFRQTNAVWAAFCAGDAVAARLAAAWRAERRARDGRRPGPLAPLRFAGAYAAAPRHLRALLRLTWPYAALGLLCGAFVLLNGGVAVGDRGSHEAVLHLPQLFYFLGFTLLCAWPHLLSPARVRAFLRAARRRPGLSCALAAGALLAVGRCTHAHPYLLADNRHYTFYLWRRVLQRHAAVKYLLVPGYLFAGWSVADALRAKSVFWVAMFFACAGAVTVPHRLLEPRYFILPFLFFRLHAPLPAVSRLLCELAGYAAVNAATFYVFLYRPFRWPDSPDLQRFMW